MTDTITVTINGRAVVFERDELFQKWPIRYRNGDVVLNKDDCDEWECWVINGSHSGGGSFTPEGAVEELQEQADQWAHTLRELARIGGET